jgi:isopenicillin N synthase-like dioxygenase
MQTREDIRYVKSREHEIPVVDLTAVKSSDPERVMALAQSLGEVCRDVGFFCVENHAVGEDFLAHVADQVYRFFDLPEDEKNKIHISKSPYHRGYFPEREENPLGSDVPDLKEGFDMALELPPDDPDVAAGKPLHGPNVWPDALPEFQPALQGLYDEFRRSCSEISGLFALALGLERDYFVDKTDKPLCQLRAVKYPPHPYVAPDENDPVACGIHTDYGIVSMIWQMDLAGLELQTPGGEWVSVPIIPGTFTCPIGDASEIWTNGYWRATPHRVVNVADRPRHSVAFFFDPNYDCVIEPFDAFVTQDRPARYDPTTMGAHVQRGFDGTFAYRKPETEPARG